MLEFEIDGFEDLQNQLESVAEAAEELENTDEISLNELFTDYFMKEYTDFSTLDEMLEAFGYDGLTQQEFDGIPDEEIDPKVSNSTSFNSWQEMSEKALDLYVSRKLDF